MDIFNNAAGDLLIAAAAHLGTWVALGGGALLTFFSLIGRQESRRGNS